MVDCLFLCLFKEPEVYMGEDRENIVWSSLVYV